MKRVDRESGAKEVAFVLGGTVPHIALIKKLQERGYYTVLIDYLDDSPAKSYADEHIQESTLDPEAVYRLAIERNASLIISVAIDQANITCCYVSERLGLPHPYSYETSLDVTHKDRMKKIMVEGRVPTAPYVSSDEYDENRFDIGFPCVVKPTNCNGSRGVHVANNHKELKEYVEDAKKASRTNEAIIEAFIEGKEISSYFYIQDGKPFLLATCEKSNYTDFDTDSVRQYESVLYPADMSQETENELIRVASQISNSFGFVNTPLFMQCIIGDDGSVYVLEFAPRLGGGLCFRSIPLLTGFDYIEAAIASFLGNKICVGVDKSQKKLLIGNMFSKPGKFDHVEIASTHDDHVFEECYVLKKPGAIIGADGSSGCRFAQFICVDDTLEGLFEKERASRRAITAYQKDGSVLNIDTL